VPVDADGNLYAEGNNMAVLSATLIDSTGSLFVNGMQLVWPTPVLVP